MSKNNTSKANNTNSKAKKSAPKSRVILPCKPYVKAYLMANFGRRDEIYGELLNLTSDRELYHDFLQRLKNGKGRYDSRISCTKYEEKVYISVSRETVRRYGWLLTPTETNAFNRILEHRVKLMLRNFVSSLRVVGVPINICIERFRKSTGITELDWDTDSIRRDLNRNLDLNSVNAEDFLQKIQKNVWCVLFEFGTISTLGLKRYTNEKNRL